MDGNFKPLELTSYLQFTREEWCNSFQDTLLTLTKGDLNKLHSQIKTVSLKEIEEIYLPLSRLLSFYVTKRQTLYYATSQFLSKLKPKVPYIIGIAGSVAVGKSTTSQVLKGLLSCWPDHPNVEIITTDSFLYSNAQLERQGLMDRKGFPESYNMSYLLRILNAIRLGKRKVSIPVYSHHYYDVIPNEYETVDQPDIVIFEGLNILQTFTKESDCLFFSNFFDFSLIIDAKIEIIKNWYINRVLGFWRGPFKSSDAYFHYLTALSEREVVQFAKKIWRRINEVNFLENILPFKDRAQLILEKMDNHSVQRVYLRKTWAEL